MKDNRLNTVNVKFGLSGMQDIYQAQRKLAADAERNMNAAIALRKALEDAGKSGTAEWKAMNDEVDRTTKIYTKQSNAVQKLQRDVNALNQVLSNVEAAGNRQLTASINAVNKAMKQYSNKKTDAAGNIIEPTQEQIDRQRALGTVLEQLTAQRDANRKGVVMLTRGLKNNQTAYNELHNIVKVYEQDGRTLAATTDNQAKTFARMGEVATQAKIRMAALDGTLVNLKTATLDELKAMETWYGKMRTYQGATDGQKNYFEKMYASTQRRISTAYQATANDPKASAKLSTNEISAQTEWMKKYSKETNLTAKEQNELTAAIKRNEEAMRQRTQNNQIQFFRQQFKEISTISKDALNEQLKYWQGVASNAELGSKAYTNATNKVKALNEEIARRKTLETQTSGEEALKRLNQGYANSSEKLKQMREHLEAYKKTLGTANTAKLQEINAALNRIDKEEAAILTSQQNYNRLLAQIKTAPLKELKSAYDALVKETELLNKGTAKYNENVRRMTALSKEIKSRNQDFKTHVTTLENAADRLKNYFLIYVGFQKIMDTIRNTFKQISELSDKMVNVQKVTGMTNFEIERLVNNLQALDTRSSTADLMALAEQAGKLGIYTKQGVQGMTQFVQMGEMISKTLGEDIGGAKAVADLAKLNDVMKVSAEVMERTGNSTTLMRDALNATGSAILNVGNNSAAGYAEIVNYVGRLGSMAGVSHISMQETIALSGALDALKKPAESGSTALAQFINAVVNRTDAMAEAAKIGTQTLRDLIANGKTYEALKLLLTQVQNGTTNAQQLMDAMSGRTKTNKNIRDVINLLSSNMELLDAQLSRAKQGFDSAFGNDTVQQIQVVMQALRDNGYKTTFENMLKDFNDFKENGIQSVMSTYKDYQGDMDILQRSLEGAFRAMAKLEAQGKLSEKAFNSLSVSTYQVSIMQKEFERVNESAAGKMERLRREITESFVNSSAVKGLQSMVTSLMEFIRWMQSGETAAKTFGTALAGLITYFTVIKLHLQKDLMIGLAALGTQLTALASGLATTVVRMTALPARIGVVRTASLLLGRTWKSLAAIMSANWLGLVAAGIAGIVYWVKSATSESSKFAKAVTEAKQALYDEQKQAAMLFSQLQNLNLAENERKSIMDQINNKYGTLLGFMLNEKTTAKELANAYELVNVKLREKAKLQLEDKMLELATEEGDKKIASGTTELGRVADSLFGENNIKQSADFQTKAYQYASEEIAKNAGRDVDEILKAVVSKLKGYNVTITSQDAEGNQYTSTKEISNTEGVKNALTTIITGMKANNTALQRVSSVMAGIDGANQNMSDDAYAKRLGIINKNAVTTYRKYKTNNAGLSNTELDESVKVINSILTDASAVAALERKGLTSQLDSLRQIAKDLSAEQFARLKLTPWGNPEPNKDDPNTWATKTLTAYHTALEKAANSTASGANLAEIFPDLADLLAGKTAEEARKVLDEEDEKIQAILKSRHMNASGQFDHKDSSSKSKTPESDSALAELDRYYLDREENIKRALAEERITEAEHNRMKLDNDKEHYEQRALLRKYFDGTMNADETKHFQDWWASTKDLDKAFWKDVQNLDKVEWSKVTAEWQKADDKAKSENRKARQKDLTQIQSDAAKAAQAIRQVLEAENPFQQLQVEFSKSLDNINVLFTDTNGLDKDGLNKMIQERTSFLVGNMDKAYTLTADALKQLMMDAKQYSWINELIDPNDETALNTRLESILSLLREYSDKFDDAVKKAASRIKKLMDMRNNIEDIEVTSPDGTTRTMSFNSMKKQDEKIGESNLKQAQRADSLLGGQNWNGTSRADEAEIDLYKMKIMYSQLYIEQLQKELETKMNVAATDDERRELELAYNSLIGEERAKQLELQSEMDEKSIERAQKSLERFTEYSDALNTFGENFGAAIFGTKEERQNAARELLKSVIQTTSKIITQKLIMLATEKLISRQQMALNQQVNTKRIQSSGEAVNMELGMKGAETVAKNAANASQGVGEEVKSKGILGIALGAVITAAMSALTALALSQIKSAETEVASISGISAGKMATGMLTYAKGRYPRYAEGSPLTPEGGSRPGDVVNVGSADGHTYNATYQPLLTTAEYTRPHLGIVGEAGAELIVDHPTLQNLKTTRRGQEALNTIYAAHRYGRTALNYPALDRSAQVLALQQQRSINRFASGNVEAVLSQSSLDSLTAPAPNASSSGQDNTRLAESLDRFTGIMENIQSNGIKAHMAMYGDDGFMEQHAAAKRYYDRIGKSY